MTYGFERLGPGGFQDLAAALAVAAFGVGIDVIGDGSDGGRDLYTRDPVAWATDEDPWVGYVLTGQTGPETIFAGAADFDLELLETRTLDTHITELVYRPTPRTWDTVAPV